MRSILGMSRRRSTVERIALCAVIKIDTKPVRREGVRGWRRRRLLQSTTRGLFEGFLLVRNPMEQGLDPLKPYSRLAVRSSVKVLRPRLTPWSICV